MRRRALLILTAALLAAADKPPDDVKKDLEKMQGTWVMTVLEIDGKLVPEEKLKDTTLVIKGDKYTTTVKGKSHEATFTLDPAKKPKAIDMTMADGPNKDKVHRGIYELDGDTLRLCRGQQPDRERPAEFGTWPDSGVFLVVWKRQKQ